MDNAFVPSMTDYRLLWRKARQRSVVLKSFVSNETNDRLGVLTGSVEIDIWDARLLR